jgi:hypothetical protein
MRDGRYSRRRFLVITCGAAAGLMCAGCAEQVGVEAGAAPTVVESSPTLAAGNAAPAAAAIATAVSEPIPAPTAAPTASAISAPVRSACPKGLINDPYPGRCRLYRDSSGNGFCDYSEV